MSANRLVPILVLAAATLLAGHVSAQPEDATAEPPPPLEPEAPPPPPPVESGETLEPDVTITRGEKEVIEEYRIHGKLYMIKVTPAAGPSYYLIDADGDGNLETRSNDLDPGFRIPGWVLFRW